MCNICSNMFKIYLEYFNFLSELWILPPCYVLWQQSAFMILLIFLFLVHLKTIGFTYYIILCCQWQFIVDVIDVKCCLIERSCNLHFICILNYYLWGHALMFVYVIYMYNGGICKSKLHTIGLLLEFLWVLSFKIHSLFFKRWKPSVKKFCNQKH